MKIAYIDVNYKKGSTGKIIYELLSSLNSGDEGLAFYGRGKSLKDNSAIKFSYDFETLCHAFLTRVTGFTGYFSFFSTKRLLKKLSIFKPDIIHIHEIHGYFMNYIPLLNYIAKHKIPVVITEHCEFNYTGRCGHSLGCDNWKNGCGKCPHKKTYPKTLLFDFSKKMLKEKREAFSKINSAIICAPSTWLLNRSKTTFLGQFEHELVKNGIDTNVFKYKDKEECRNLLKLDRNKKIVLCVASDLFGPYKGGNLFLDVVRSEKMKDYEFILIGDNKPIKNCPTNVLFAGPIYDQDKLVNYYCAADVFLITSVIETFPTTCLEAACCGTPVVGFNVGGVAETTMPNYGSFAKLGDINGMVDAIQKMSEKQFNRKEISNTHIELYSLNRMSEKYKDIYRKIIKRN